MIDATILKACFTYIDLFIYIYICISRTRIKEWTGTYFLFNLFCIPFWKGCSAWGIYCATPLIIIYLSKHYFHYHHLIIINITGGTKFPWLWLIMIPRKHSYPRTSHPCSCSLPTRYMYVYVYICIICIICSHMIDVSIYSMYHVLIYYTCSCSLRTRWSTVTCTCTYAGYGCNFPG
jgi:hypothetical protein